MECNAQAISSIDFYKELKQYNLAKVWTCDSIGILDTSREIQTDKIKRAEPLGYIDSNYQRFQIHFSSVKKSKENPYKYLVKGLTKVDTVIHHFSGSILIIQCKLFIESELPKFKQGYIIGDVQLFENKVELGSGSIIGKVTSQFIIDKSGQLQYDATMIIADGFSNNEFECTWKSYTTKQEKKCNWGDYRIPDSNGLDDGAGEFIVNPKYLNNGWQNYGTVEEIWWRKINVKSAKEIEKEVK